MTTHRWAFFSEQHAETFGSYYFKTAEGREVEVTAVLDKRDTGTSYNWPDAKFVGEVVSFSRIGRKGREQQDYDAKLNYNVTSPAHVS